MKVGASALVVLRRRPQADWRSHSGGTPRYSFLAQLQNLCWTDWHLFGWLTQQHYESEDLASKGST
ncbi:MAG TPA: hypothetical protein VFN35_35330, partial [Ktedonobacteraceae bacterium]|nr:hypothetical protein [Ktedonobacteraceae bacterium]